MYITSLELLAPDLDAQGNFYANTLELPVALGSRGLEIRAGSTDILFTQAGPGFEGAYHFAFNIPANLFESARAWAEGRFALLHDRNGVEAFRSDSWNSDSLYFEDAAGNILEFIARHNLDNDAEGNFDSDEILNVSEIGLPSEDVVGLAQELCAKLDLAVFKQTPNETFTPVGDDHGLFILPAKERIWMPDSGVPARLLPVRVRGATASGMDWEVRGVPYVISRS